MNRLILFCFSLAITSCVATDVGNPEDEKVDVELDFSGYEQTQAGALTLESDARIDSAWIVLSQFRFQSKSACGEEGPFDATEPVVIDLLASEPTYELPMFTKKAGDYCKLDIGFSNVPAEELPESAPAGLADQSVYVTGARSDGVEFRIEAEFDTLFHLNGALQSFKLEQGSNHLIVGFALDAWLNEPKLDAVRGEDPIIINATTRPEMLADFEAAVGRSTRLFRDRNENRRLDADEQGEVMAAGAQERQNNQSTDRQGQQRDGGSESAPDVQPGG
jgi:hypothetical protein